MEATCPHECTQQLHHCSSTVTLRLVNGLSSGTSCILFKQTSSITYPASSHCQYAATERGSPPAPCGVGLFLQEDRCGPHVSTTLRSYFYGSKIPQREMWLSSFILTLYIDQLLQGEKTTLTVKASILDLTISSLTWQ